MNPRKLKIERAQASAALGEAFAFAFNGAAMTEERCREVMAVLISELGRLSEYQAEALTGKVDRERLIADNRSYENELSRLVAELHSRRKSAPWNTGLEN